MLPTSEPSSTFAFQQPSAAHSPTKTSSPRSGKAGRSRQPSAAATAASSPPRSPLRRLIGTGGLRLGRHSRALAHQRILVLDQKERRYCRRVAHYLFNFSDGDRQ